MFKFWATGILQTYVLQLTLPGLRSTVCLHSTLACFAVTANESGTEDPLFGKSAANGKPAATFGKEVITSIDPTSFMKKGAKTKPAAPDGVVPVYRARVCSLFGLG